MPIRIKSKNSVVKDKAPLPADLEIGELALNAHQDSPAIYLKDAAGTVQKIAGAGAVGATDATTTAKGVVQLADAAAVTAGTVGRVVDAKELKDGLTFLQDGANARPRTIISKLKDTVSVKDFGAVGDGTTDDSAAFDAAAAVAEVVYVPEGSYLISTFPNLSLFLSKGWFGPGRVLYNNGSYTEQIGKILRVGVNDPDGNLGTVTQGGVMIGGEGPGSTGTLLSSQQNSQVVFQTQREGSSTEVQIYPNASIGVASTVAGSTFIDATYGDFSKTYIEAGDIITLGRKYYKIKSKVSNTRLELQAPDGSAITNFTGAVSDTYRHIYHYAKGVCSTNGTAVTRVSGSYFLVTQSDYGFNKIKINGVDYSVASAGDRSATLTTSAGTQTNVPFTHKVYPLGAYSTLLRLQGLHGNNEENVALYMSARGDGILETQKAGTGHYQSLALRTGPDTVAAGGAREHIFISPDGQVSFGGHYADDGYPNRSKVFAYAEQATAAATDGSSALKVLTLDTRSAGLDPRQLTFGFFNNYNCGFIQGYENEAGTTVGDIVIQPLGGKLKIGGGSVTYTPSTLSVVGNASPAVDNTYTCGIAAYRWSVIYAGTGTVNTSDAREKTFLDITAAEKAAALEIKANLRKFKWNDALKAKGDSARIHFGASAQQVGQIMRDHGLKPEEYGFYCYDSWNEEIDKSGSVVQQAGDRYGIRYDELLAFILSAL